MKSKITKKFIAVICSVALMISAASTVMFATVSADTTSSGRSGVSKLIYDFEDDTAKDEEGNLSYTANKYRSKLWSSNGNAWNGTDIVVNSTLADSPFSAWKSTYGNFSAMEHGSGTTHGFYLPSGWADPYTVDGKTYQRPNAIVFDVMTTGGERSYSKTTLNGTSVEVTGELKQNTITTITVKIPKDMDLTTDNAIFKWSVWTQNQKLYLDNVRVEYYDGYQATFESTKTAVLSSAVDSIFQDITAGQTSITLPTATLNGDKTFAGWVTADDINTVLPAGKKVSLEDDVTYYAVATDRGAYPTPDAPVVSAKTFNSVTLTSLGTGYVYSKDGKTWQESNVFTSLAPSTEYTFYVKHIATTAYFESKVSEGTTVTTEPNMQFEFSKEYVTLSDNTAKLQFKTTGLAYKCITANVAADKSVTVTTNYTVAPGVYDLTLYARSYGTRAKVDIEVNGTIVGKSVDTSATGKGGDNVDFSLGYITIPQTTVLTINITTKTSGNLYLNSLKLTEKDYNIAMNSGASIRLNEQKGIRFISKVNTDKIAELEAAGYNVTLGTLIAPKDNVTDGDLKFDTVEAGKYVDVQFNAKKDDGSFDWNGGVEGQIAGSLVGIKDANIARDFIGRGYIKATNGEDTQIIYADYAGVDVANNTRSIQTVAQKFQGTDEYNAKDDDIKALVDKWATYSTTAE